MRFLPSLALLLLAAPVAAQEAPPPELPSVALTPALERVLRDYETAWRKGDAKALAELFAEDGFVLQNGRAPVRGRLGVAQAYAGQGGGALKLRALAASASDTVAYIIGAYGYGDTPGDMGKFTLTLRRARGGPWLIFSDMDNASRPPRRPGAPPPSPPPSNPTPPSPR